MRVALDSYWSTGIAYVRLPESPDNRLVVQFELKQKLPSLANPKPITIHDFVKEFCNSLLDFELRREVEIETAQVRQLILAKAFSQSGVLEDEPPGTVAEFYIARTCDRQGHARAPLSGSTRHKNLSKRQSSKERGRSGRI